jgi:hypothetical protein
VVDVELKYVQAVTDIFHEVFDDLPKNMKRCFGYTWNVPLECEVKIGMDMKNMKKVARSA